MNHFIIMFKKLLVCMEQIFNILFIVIIDRLRNNGKKRGKILLINKQLILKNDIFYIMNYLTKNDLLLFR